MTKTLSGYIVEMKEVESNKKPGFIEVNISDFAGTHKTIFIKNTIYTVPWFKAIKKIDVSYFLNVLPDGQAITADNSLKTVKIA